MTGEILSGNAIRVSGMVSNRLLWELELSLEARLD
jgi:hypothetical protein